MRIIGLAVAITLLVAACAARDDDLRRHGPAYAGHPRMSAERPSEDEVRAAQAEGSALGARDERAAAALVSRALAWLEWLRRSGWLTRLQGPECEPMPVQVHVEAQDPTGADVLDDLVARRMPDDCRAAERVLEAVRALRGALERTPIAGVLAPLRAAIEGLASPSRACDPPSFTGPALAAVRHVTELELLDGGGPGCPSMPTVGGHVLLDAVRTTEPVEVDFERATAPRAPQEGVYDFEHRPHLRASPPFRERLVQLEVRFVGGHGMSSYLVLLSRFGGEWRVIEVVGPAHA